MIVAVVVAVVIVAAVVVVVVVVVVVAAAAVAAAVVIVAVVAIVVDVVGSHVSKHCGLLSRLGLHVCLAEGHYQTQSDGVDHSVCPLCRLKRHKACDRSEGHVDYKMTRV